MRADLTDETADTVRNGDRAAVAEILEQRFISTELLAEILLLRARDGALQHLALLAIGRRLATPQSRAALVGLAGLLPGLCGASPEIAVVLADLYRRLARWRGPGSLPDWRGAGLPVAAQIAWLRTELSVDHPTARHLAVTRPYR